MYPQSLVTVFFGLFLLGLEVFLPLSYSQAAIGPGGPTKRYYTVVIDPGHGGKDAGSIGKLKIAGKKQPLQTYEKHLNLILAKQLRNILLSNAYTRAMGRPIRVFLTREKDVFVSLDKRGLFARQKKPDLFLSIHMNAEPTGTARGFETYFLNNTTERADFHQEKLNSRNRIPIAATSPDLSLLLRSVLTDSTVSLSKDAASIVQREVEKQLKQDRVALENRGIRQSLLQLLLDTEVPAVLFEGLYLSNQEDLRIGRSDKGMESLARGLARGVSQALGKNKVSL